MAFAQLNLDIPAFFGVKLAQAADCKIRIRQTFVGIMDGVCAKQDTFLKEAKF